MINCVDITTGEPDDEPVFSISRAVFERMEQLSWEDKMSIWGAILDYGRNGTIPNLAKPELQDLFFMFKKDSDEVIKEFKDRG